MHDHPRTGLPFALPPGFAIGKQDGTPALWMTEEAVADGLWAAAFAERAGTGRYPLLLGALYYDNEAEFRPWETGELHFSEISDPAAHDPAAVLGTWWRNVAEDEDPDLLDPLDETWPGLAPTTLVPGTVDTAPEYASALLGVYPGMRLGLVNAARGSDALAVAGWQGPLNYTDDTGEIAAVVRSWEDRFGVQVVGVGFDTLYLSVAAPPTTPEAALVVAAEHFAFCPDNLWQSENTMADYAGDLVGARSWVFWWD